MSDPVVRTCECGCDASMEGRRRGARFLNAAHRKAAWSREHPETAPRPLASVENGSHTTVGSAPRRPNAPGRGVRVYFGSVAEAMAVAGLLRRASAGGLSLDDWPVRSAERIERATLRQRERLS